jgi:hypothetical protein
MVADLSAGVYSNFETWMPCAGHLAHRSYVPLDVNLRAGITKGVI